MNTNINDIDGSYAKDTITYDDSQIDTLLSDLSEVLNILSQIESEVAGVEANEKNWEGESKVQYTELKGFVKQYRTDYGSSVKELKKTVNGLKTLLGSISSSHVIQEIDGA